MVTHRLNTSLIDVISNSSCEIYTCSQGQYTPLPQSKGETNYWINKLISPLEWYQAFSLRFLVARLVGPIPELSINKNGLSPPPVNYQECENPVEVLYGSESNPKHSRRRADIQSRGDDRALDWGVLDTDILLYPHSPLALVDVLSENGGYLDLLPSDDSNLTNYDIDESVIASVNRFTASGLHTVGTESQVAKQGPHAGQGAKSGRKKRTPKDRFNLLTKHNAKNLLDQCKKILVDNALIKTKGDKQLYLAAGFIIWQDASSDSQRAKRAPLLLYPALLVRVPEKARYEIRLSGEFPEFNHALREHAELLYGVNLPGFDVNEPLSDFLAQVAESIKDSSTLELEFNIAVGTASLMCGDLSGAQSRNLPPLPEQFCAPLAMNIAKNKSLYQLNSVLQLIPDYTETAYATGTSNTAESNQESIVGLRKYSARLAAEGLDHVEFRHLSSLPERIANWVKAVETGLNSKTISQVLGSPELSSRELIRLSGIIELIDKAPAVLDSIAHPDLCYAHTALLLRRAQHQAKLIEDELDSLQKHFVLDKVPAKSQLLSLVTELGGTLRSDIDYIGEDYFNARRQFMEFSIEKTSNLTADHRRMLSQLVKVLRFRELFVNNTEYRSALGPGYKGLRTQWSELTMAGEYSRELAQVIESDALAASIVGNWQAFRSSYSYELETLQNAADASRRLLGSVGTHWQKKPIRDLIAHAHSAAEKLKDWGNSYTLDDVYAEKTPAMVLSSFSGKSRDNVVIEAQVDDARTLIKQQLDSTDLSRDEVAHTLAWLLAAGKKASENNLDVDAIVEHLHIS